MTAIQRKIYRAEENALTLFVLSDYQKPEPRPISLNANYELVKVIDTEWLVANRGMKYLFKDAANIFARQYADSEPMAFAQTKLFQEFCQCHSTKIVLFNFGVQILPLEGLIADQEVVGGYSSFSQAQKHLSRFFGHHLQAKIDVVISFSDGDTYTLREVFTREEVHNLAEPFILEKHVYAHLNYVAANSVLSGARKQASRILDKLFMSDVDVV